MGSNAAPFYVPKTVSLIGIMGSGKSTIGVRLAKKLALKFFDSDQQIENAAGGYTVAEIYERWGEEVFDSSQVSVIERLLKTEPPHILSTGEGAFIKPESRQILQNGTITVWLKTDLNLIVDRVRRKMRPQIQEEENLEEALGKLIAERSPMYETADICVECNDACYQDAVDRVFQAIKDYLYPSQRG